MGKRGTFLGLPYDWRRPTWQRVKESVWRPDDPRLWLPRAYGWGLSINVHRVLHPGGRSPRSRAERQ
jgi:hypothetical protein